MVTDGNIIKLSSGELLLLVYGEYTGDSGSSITAMTSSDGGLHWQYVGLVAPAQGHAGSCGSPAEHDVTVLEDGRLLAVFR